MRSAESGTRGESCGPRTQDARILVVRTGTANLASVLAGLARAGGQPVLTDDAEAVRAAPRVVLPGVGAFGAAMQRLSQHEWVEPLCERLRAGRATLAICLGLQILFESSEESPGVAGLGFLPGQVRRFPPGVRVPQLGWNRVAAGSSCRFLRDGYAYFANSFCLRDAPAGWAAAHADHGGRFVAALERGAILACQFHPELSGAWGVALLRRWIERTATPDADPVPLARGDRETKSTVSEPSPASAPSTPPDPTAPSALPATCVELPDVVTDWSPA